jgi:uncharacterized SAM-binding protein YcdF (DUF218 family)
LRERSSEPLASDSAKQGSGREVWSLRGRILTWAAVVATFAWLFAWAAAQFLIVSAPLDRADVIVVLSGSAAYRERTLQAAELYRAGIANKIVLTNDGRQGSWSTVEQRNPFYYERAREELQAQGVPSDVISALQQPVSNTYDEALLLRSYVDENSVRSLVLVTSAYHSRRALWMLNRVLAGKKVAIGITPAPTGLQTSRPAWWWLSLAGWKDVAAE